MDILADDHDTHDQDIADGIENTVALDGQNTTTNDNAILRFDSGNTAFEGVPISASELVGRSGAGDVRSLSAATVRSVIAALGATADKATSAQATAGSANNVYMTPARSTTFLHEQTGLAASAFSAIGNGAIVESGTNANGSYVRWENGEQVCWIDQATMTQQNTATIRYVWTYPASFNADPAVIHTPTGGVASLSTGGQKALIRSGAVDTADANLDMVDTDSSPFGVSDEMDTRGIAWGFWK